MLAADYPFLDVLWTMIVFAFFVMYIWIVIMVLADNFRRNDHGGRAKAGWTLFIICLPLLGVLVYMLARPKMTEQDQQLLARPTGNGNTSRATRRPTSREAPAAEGLGRDFGRGVRVGEEEGAGLTTSRTIRVSAAR